MATQDQYLTLCQSLYTLSTVCDGAQKQDGMGFNGSDSAFGKDLAATCGHYELSERQQAAAIKMLQKYRNQLAGLGVSSLPTVSEYGDAYSDSPIQKTPDCKSPVTITGQDGKIVVRFSGSKQEVFDNKELIKTLPYRGRKFDFPSMSWIIEPEYGRMILDMFPGADVDERVSNWISGSGAHRQVTDGDTVVIGDNTASAHTSTPVAAPVKSQRVDQMTVRLVKDKIEMRTPYYTKEWHALCVDVPGRKFKELKGRGKDSKPQKFWVAPTSSVGYIIETMTDNPIVDLDPGILEMAENLAKRASSSRVHSAKLSDDLPIPDGLAPMPFQAAGYNFLKDAGFRALLTDEMGLGKTIQAILAIMKVRHEGPVVVSCPASVKLNWRNELEKWIPGIRVSIIEGKKPNATIDSSMYDVFVINHDILAYRESKTSKDIKGWYEEFLGVDLSLVIFDEGHKVGNQKTIRGQAARAIAKQVDRVIVLSGTPLPNRPKELWPLLNLIDPGAWPNFFQYAMKYCDAHQGAFGWDFTGASNLQELHEEIRPWVLRRTNAEVNKELPDSRRVDIVIQLSKRQRKEYDNAVSEFSQKIRAHELEPGDHLKQIGLLKQLAAQAKIKSALDWIGDYLESGEKLIVFAWHKAIIDAVMESLAKRKIKAVKLTGGTSTNARQAAVDAFQNDDSVQVFVGNIKAAGEGITLTAAKASVFLEYGWTPGEHAQAEARNHRIGQKFPTTQYYLNAQDTIDESIFRLIDGKRQVIDIVIDGKTEDLESTVMVLDGETGTVESDSAIVEGMLGRYFR